MFAFLNCINNNIIKITGKVYAYDINDELIYFYKNIQNNHIQLYNEITILQSLYNNKNLEEKEKYYYNIRQEYNKLGDKHSIKASAIFIFLNKTCFRGIYRVGPRGFNVPFGNYKNPEIINKDYLNYINNLLKNVIFEIADFNKSLTNIQNDDFIYLDPSYIKETKTSFTKYHIIDFNLQSNLLLFEKCIKLDNELCIKIMMNNSNNDYIKKIFETKDNFMIEIILCKRTINSKNPNSKTEEIILTNY